MPRKKHIRFIETRQPIAEFVTKFGGQPCWLAEPEWPVSKSSGEPMRFIGQVAINPELFGPVKARMAYLFMTDDPNVDNTWDCHGGENALILQPGDNPTKTIAQSIGPTLYRMTKKFFGAVIAPKTLEFATTLTLTEDPDWLPESAEFELPDTEFKTRHDRLAGNKIGGTPGFLQGDEFPGSDEWKLLLQLDSGDLPFRVNFGDVGIGYAFISKDGTKGKFLWQCC